MVHELLPLTAAKVRSGHGSQSEAPFPEYFPGAQPSHSLAPWLEYVPASQLVHWSSPSAEYFPASHAAHSATL